MNKPWMQTYSGHQWIIGETDGNIVDIRDIVHSLSHKVRFNGHCKYFYSVAQHCCLMYDSLRGYGLTPEIGDEVRLQALLHDADEAYLGDIISPMEAYFPEIGKYRRAVRRYVLENFHVDPELPDIIHKQDRRLLAAEYYAIMHPQEEPWDIIKKEVPLPVAIEPWTPMQSKVEFADRLTTAFHRWQQVLRQRHEASGETA